MRSGNHGLRERLILLVNLFQTFDLLNGQVFSALAQRNFIHMGYAQAPLPTLPV